MGIRKASLGEFGYEVYVKDNTTGSISSLGFTTKNTFKTTKQDKNVTYIVKTSWSVLKITQSAEAQIEVSADVKKDTDLTTIELNKNSTGDTLTLSGTSVTYTDPGVKVTNNGIDVTKDATITVTCSNNEKNISTYTFTSAGKLIQ